MPGRPTSEKSITGEPAPRSPFSGGRVPSKPMPGSDRPTPPSGKRMPGKPPMPGAQAPGARKPMPGVGSKFDTPDLPTSPGVEKAKRMVDKASEPGKVGRRILGLDPKVASEAGFSLAGRPAIKRPPAKKRPLRRATGVKRVRKEENDG